MTLKSFFPGWLLLAILAGVGAGTVTAQPPAAPASTLEGNWSGVLVVPRNELRLVVTIRRAANGQLTGSVAGLDQGNPSNPIDAIEQSGNRVKMVVGEIGGGFEGILSDDGTKLTGRWSEIAIGTPLELVRLPAGPSPAAP